MEYTHPHRIPGTDDWKSITRPCIVISDQLAREAGFASAMHVRCLEAAERRPVSHDAWERCNINEAVRYYRRRRKIPACVWRQGAEAIRAWLEEPLEGILARTRAIY